MSIQWRTFSSIFPDDFPVISHFHLLISLVYILSSSFSISDCFTMEIKNKSQKNLPQIYSEDYQHVPIYDDGFHQPTAPSEQHVVITQQPQQVIIQSKYYFKNIVSIEGYIIRAYTSL